MLLKDNAHRLADQTERDPRERPAVNAVHNPPSRASLYFHSRILVSLCSLAEASFHTGLHDELRPLLLSHEHCWMYIRRTGKHNSLKPT